MDRPSFYGDALSAPSTKKAPAQIPLGWKKRLNGMAIWHMFPTKAYNRPKSHTNMRNSAISYSYNIRNLFSYKTVDAAISSKKNWTLIKYAKKRCHTKLDTLQLCADKRTALWQPKSFLVT